MSTTVPDVRLTDRARREWYLLRFAWAMEDYPRRASKTIRRDLRADLEAAVADVGTARALRDLGHPFVLAERYREELGRRIPRYAAGAAAAALAVAALLYLAAAYSVGALDALEALGGGTITTHPLGATTTFTSTADGMSVESQVTWQSALLHVTVATVTFALVSRIWRAIP
ncbi:MAG: hypothetical protein JWP95_827 [Actinotalea sp.]|nr:hypothetical protein [Actinotalea sp.]